MSTVFQKFGGIRPMARALGVPPSTVKSWHAKGRIPQKRQPHIVQIATSIGLPITPEELTALLPARAR